MTTKNSPQSFMSFSTILLLLTGLVAIYSLAQIHAIVKRAETLRDKLGHSAAVQTHLDGSQRQQTSADDADAGSSFCDALPDEIEQLKELNAATLKAITRAVWLVIICVSIAMICAMKGHHRLQNTLIRPINKMILSLESINKDGPQTHQLPIQHDPLLNDLAGRINKLIDKQQTELDKSGQQLHSLQQAALTLVNVLPRPTILFAGQHDIFVANQLAWDIIAGEGGKSILAHMREAIAKGEDHFRSHGLHFRLNTLNHGNDDAPSWLRLIEIAPGEESKDNATESGIGEDAGGKQKSFQS